MPDLGDILFKRAYNWADLSNCDDHALECTRNCEALQRGRFFAPCKQGRLYYSINMKLIRFFLASSLTLILLASCSSAPKIPLIEPNEEITLTHGDERVGSYVSSWNGFRTSSYWINAPGGLILIDTQFLPSATEEMLNWAEKVTGKKAVLAIVLHPNPDKFNGTAFLQSRGIRVITSEQVLELIPAVHHVRLGWFYERFRPDYPLTDPQPESFGNHDSVLDIAGAQLRLHVMGAGCSKAHVVVEFDKHIFVGDLVTQGFHSWLELGLLREWITRIDELKGLNPEYVHTGRGGSGDASLLDREKDYLKDVISIVKRSKGDTDKAYNEIIARYPAYDYPRFVENGLEAVSKKLISSEEND